MGTEIDWHVALTHLYKIGLAFAIALPVAWNRERSERTAGLRTFPLVAVAACGYMLVGLQVLSSTDAEARVFYGIIAGMGFIGGGAILKNRHEVSGTATAASLWNTGAIGVAVAYNRYEIAIVLSLINMLTLYGGKRFKSQIDTEDAE